MTIKTVLLDLSGTLHVGKTAIPGAIEAVRRLQQSSLNVRFLTNTTKASRVQLLSQLREIGFTEAEIPDIVTATGIVRELLTHKYHNMNPFCLLEPDLIQNDLSDIVDNRNGEKYNCVVVGLAPGEFCYSRLNDAFRILLEQKDAGATHPTLIALHKGRYYRDSDDQLSLGPGGFVSLLEEASGVEALVVGKPNVKFFQSAIPTDTLPQETVMVGDDVLSDVIGAKDAGIGMGILVKTGKYRENDELKYPEKAVDYTVDSIVEAVDLILSSLEQDAGNENQ